jgi:competence protein ComEA
VPDLPRTHLIAYALIAVAVAWFGVRQLRRAKAGEAPQAVAPISVRHGEPRGHGRVVVHVAGAVARPGVYRLRTGSRVDDAVRRAGGPRRRADLTQVNLAQELDDGRQIVVPVRTPAGAAPVAGAPAGPVNLNTATLEQLDALQGIGPVTAQEILDYREAHGGFRDVAELDQVPGIGEATMASLKDEVTA